MVVANMREVGAPVYTEEELAFARELGQSISPEAKLSGLRRSLLPNALELVDVDINPNIYDPYGAERKGGGGSTDVAEVSWNTPTVEFNTAQFVVGSPGHSWQNTAVSGTSIGHKSTLFAAKVMATTVVDLLTQPEALAQVRADFDARMQGLSYKSPLPPDLQPPLDQFEH
jgi:aminobenzoyl-glutamate utilization protein B